jgi:hypothetical protein
MNRPSPTRDGFHAMFARPYVGIMEVLWRWSFGATFWLLAFFCFAEYLQSLPIRKEQLFLLASGQSMLALKALQQIFHGSTPRLIRAFLLLACTATFGWIALAAIGRAATLRPLIHKEEGKVTSGSLLGLNVLRALAFVLTAGLTIAIFVLLSSNNSDSDSVTLATLLSLALIFVAWCGWGVGNWFLSLAVIFVAKENCGTFSALARASDLSIKRFGAVFAVTFWFGLAKITAWYIVGLFCFLLIGVAPLSPAAAMAALIAASLGYFFLADFLYVGRMAGYISITDLPQKSAKAPYLTLSPVAPVTQIASAVDPDELILSDHPELAD